MTSKPRATLTAKANGGRRGADRLAQFAETAFLLNSAGSAEGALRVMTEKARQLIGANVAVGSLVASAGQPEPRTIVSRSRRPDATSDEHGSLDLSRLRTLLATITRPMRLNRAQLAAHRGWRRRVSLDGQSAWPRAWLAAPLQGPDGASIGLLELFDKRRGDFTERDEALLVQLTQMTSVAVESLRLQSEAEQRRREADDLVQIARALTESLDVSVVAERIAETVLSLFDVQASTLRLLERNQLVPVASCGPARHHLTKGHHVPKGHVLPLGVSVSGRAAVERRPVWSSDVLSDAAVPLTDEVRAATLAAGIRASLAVPLDVKGRIIGTLSIADPTPRVFSEAEVRLLQAFADQAALALENTRLYAEVKGTGDFLQSIATNSVDAIVTTDVHGRITYFSPGGEEMLGFRADEVVGRRIADFARTGLDETRAFMRRLRDEGRIRDYESAIYTKDGRRVESASSFSLLRDARGATIGTVGLIRDVTDRKRTEEALRQSEKVAAMGALLAGVAHELNNPLAVVLAHCDLLQQQAEGPLAERTAKIAASARRCARIVKSFLALARQQAPERSAVALNRTVREAVELLAYPLRVDSVEVVMNLADDLPSLWADPHQLHQVLVNLMINAHQAMRQMPPPRRLAITTQFDPSRGRVVVEVADTGPGIPPEIRAKIFEPFFTTKPPGQGTGLGLSMCQGIVEDHGGTIAVESEPGRGAVLRVELPVRPSPVSAASAEKRATPAPGKSILVVDDEPDVGAVLADLLSLDGHRVDVVPNGVIALQRLQEGAYDLVMSDLKMPELDGAGLYRQLDRLRHPVLSRFVFITGDVLGPETRSFLEETGAPCVGKPFSLDEIREVVQAALAR